MVTIINRRLDKIRLINTYPTSHAMKEYSTCLGRAMSFADSGQLKRISGKYRTIFYRSYNDGDEKSTLRFDFGPSKYGGTIAIEFIPRLLTDIGWADVASFISVIIGEGVVWKKFRIQVMELAMDVKQPFSNFIFFAEGLPSSNITYLHKGTLYIGAKYGRRSFCIYDKRKQLFEKKNKLIDHPLTRIEVRKRGLQVTFSKLQSVPNPFIGLIALQKSKLPEIKKAHPQDQILAMFIAAVKSGATGHEAYWNNSSENRKRLLKVLRPHALKLGASPKHWNKWIEQLLDALALNFKDF